MALINCPECGKEISDKALSCPKCGYPIANILETNDQSFTTSSSTDSVAGNYIFDLPATSANESASIQTTESDPSHYSYTAPQAPPTLYSQQQYHSQPQSPKKKRLFEILAICSLILTIFSLVAVLEGSVFFFALLTIIFSIIALAKKEPKVLPIINLSVLGAIAAILVIGLAVTNSVGVMTTPIQTPENKSCYYFAPIPNLVFTIPEEFESYSNYFCATPKEDYVSLMFFKKDYSGSWTEAADKYEKELLKRHKGHHTNNGAVYTTISGYEGRQYRCQYTDGALVCITCINNPQAQTLLCVMLAQDPDNSLENDYESAYSTLLSNASIRDINVPATTRTASSKKDEPKEPTKEVTKEESKKADTETYKGSSDLEKKGKALFNSYEDIYNEYTKKLKEEYEKDAKKLDEEINAKKSVDYLAESSAEMVDRLAGICDEGIEVMADKVNVFNTGDYMSWATKLTNEYMSYATDIEAKYMSGAMSNIFY